MSLTDPERRRLRLFIPSIMALLCCVADIPGGGYLLLIGLAGGALVWIEDCRAPLTPWASRFPRVPWSQVERLPSREQRRSLAQVCAEVDGAIDELAAASGAPGLKPKVIRGELAGLLALAADLGAQLETLTHQPGADVRRARIEGALNAIVPAIQRLRCTLRRASAPGLSAHRPRLGSLLTLERELSAHQDCLDEMEELPCVQ